MAAVPFTLVTDPQYATAAASTFSVELLPSAAAPAEIDLGGPCPRCEHQMTLRYPILVVKGVGPIDEATALGLWSLIRQRGGEVPDQWDVPVTCECIEAHPVRPEREAGCGAYWGMRVERQAEDQR